MDKSSALALIARELRIASRQAEFWAQRQADLSAEQARIQAR